MKSQNLWFLENIDVKGIFCPKKLVVPSHSHCYKSYKKGEYIYLPEEDSNKIYFINSGRVKIGSIGKGEKEITKAIISKGEVFGELAIVGEGKRNDYALTIEDTNVCLMERAVMKDMLRDHNAFYLFIMQTIGARAIEMEKRLESLVFKDSRSRIIEFLLDLNQKENILLLSVLELLVILRVQERY